MENVENVRCYCFNPLCKSSIFGSKKDITVFEPLTRVLTEKLRCKECNEELVSKPALKLKIQIDGCLHDAVQVEHPIDDKHSISYLFEPISH